MEKKQNFHGQNLWESKLLKVMKLTVFLMLISLMGVFASETYSQTTRLTVNANKMSLEDFLVKIENQSEFRFFYTGKINVEQEVSGEFRNKKIFDILDEIKDEAGFQYEVLGRQIILSPNNAEGAIKSIQQQKSVSGKVTDSSGFPLPGVTVLIEGTTTGTVTNADGSYTLSNIPDDATLQFSFVGMKTQKVPVGNKTSVNVTMEEETVGIEEVVAVGYGTQSKRDLTGAISSVKSEDLKDRPAINAIQALQGKASGVTVVQQTGAPGAPFMVQVRGVGTLGNTQPLFVIDGIVGAGGSNYINPNDIESIDILKDASSAAIYGSRAANGVVLITTKKGIAGKPKISFDSYVGVQSVWKKLDVLNAKQYAEYSNELQTNGGQPLIPALNDPSALKDVTNWQDEIFRNGIIQNYNLNISGGNENGRYLFSSGYFDQQGILINTGFKRYSFRANSDFNIGKKLKVGETVLVSSTNTFGINEGSSQSLVNSIHMPTYIPVYDPTELGGYDGTDVADGTDPKNPVRILKLTERNNKYIGILGNAYLSYEFIEGLEYKFSFSVDYSTGAFYNYTPKYTSGERDVNLYSTLSESFNRGNTMMVENTLNYKKIIGKHKFSALAGYTRQWYENRGFGVNVRDFPSTDVRVVGAATTILSASGSTNDWALASLLGRVTYSYDGKYLFTSNIRRDGSSRFSKGNKYGVFPSFSVGWRMSDEEFLKNSNVISDLKLKYGWGQLGMQEIGLYPYQATLTSTIKYVLGSTQATVPGITQLALSNFDISWEKTSQTNIGIDLGLFNDQIVVNAEYYVRKTDDMLIQVPVSVSAGLKTNPTLNTGSVENTGVDLMVTYQKEFGDFKFGLSGNASYLLNNEVTSLGLRTQPLFGKQSYQRSVVGESIGHFFGYRVDHIYQNQSEVDADNALAISKGWTLYQAAKTSPGDIRFKDINGDGHITADDREIIGSPIPKWNYGLTVRANYMNFDFSVMFQGMAGFEAVNRNRLLMWESMTRSFNTITTVLDRWTPTNPSTTMPRAVAGDPNKNARFSDRWIENGAFTRLKLVTLGYQVPESFLNKISKDAISSVRFYASANNLLTFTKFSAWDPEFTNNGGFDNMYRGVAESIYPQARSFMFGINVGF